MAQSSKAITDKILESLRWRDETGIRLQMVTSEYFGREVAAAEIAEALGRLLSKGWVCRGARITHGNLYCLTTEGKLGLRPTREALPDDEG